MIETIEIKWDLLGARLARLSDEEQGKFFTGFGIEMGNYESTYKGQMQLLHARDDIPDDVQEYLKEVLPMLWEVGDE